LGIEPAPGIRREGLIMKDVPDAVVQEGLREYERWRTNREQTIARGSTPSLAVRTATEWAASERGEETERVERAIDDVGAQPGLFDDPAQTVRPRATAPAGTLAGDDVRVVDARGKSRPGGARFGELVHAVLAAVPLDADAAAIEGLVDVHGRIVSAPPEEIAAARETIARVLAHELIGR